MWIDCVTIVLLLSAIFYEGTHIKCGIKLVTWNSIYLLAMFTRITISTTKTFIFRHFPDIGPLYSLASFVLVDGFILSWQLYGITLVNKEKHTCGSKAPTLYNMMIALLILGITQIIIYFIFMAFYLVKYI